MTMADTVAVMNGGRVEQLGAPAELYENPRTTFVANFLGTSNLIEAEVASAAGDEVVATAGGTALRLPRRRCPDGTRTGGRLLVGVRPEKISLLPAGEAGTVAPGRNTVTGRVTDSSFIGVSTQYVVESPAGKAVEVYAQNTGQRTGLGPGAEVILHWDPEHTFGLDAAQDIAAGTESAEETP